MPARDWGRPRSERLDAWMPLGTHAIPLLKPLIPRRLTHEHQLAKPAGLDMSICFDAPTRVGEASWCPFCFLSSAQQQEQQAQPGGWLGSHVQASLRPLTCEGGRMASECELPIGLSNALALALQLQQHSRAGPAAASIASLCGSTLNCIYTSLSPLNDCHVCCTPCRCMSTNIAASALIQF